MTLLKNDLLLFSMTSIGLCHLVNMCKYQQVFPSQKRPNCWWSQALTKLHKQITQIENNKVKNYIWKKAEQLANYSTNMTKELYPGLPKSHMSHRKPSLTQFHCSNIVSIAASPLPPGWDATVVITVKFLAWVKQRLVYLIAKDLIAAGIITEIQSKISGLSKDFHDDFHDTITITSNSTKWTKCAVFTERLLEVWNECLDPPCRILHMCTCYVLHLAHTPTVEPNGKFCFVHQCVQYF